MAKDIFERDLRKRVRVSFCQVGLDSGIEKYACQTCTTLSGRGENATLTADILRFRRNKSGGKTDRRERRHGRQSRGNEMTRDTT